MTLKQFKALRGKTTNIYEVYCKNTGYLSEMTDLRRSSGTVSRRSTRSPPWLSTRSSRPSRWCRSPRSGSDPRLHRTSSRGPAESPGPRGPRSSATCSWPRMQTPRGGKRGLRRTGYRGGSGTEEHRGHHRLHRYRYAGLYPAEHSWGGGREDLQRVDRLWISFDIYFSWIERHPQL